MSTARVVGSNIAAQRLLRMRADMLIGSAADDFVDGWRLLAEDYASASPTVEPATCPLRTILVEVVTADGSLVPALASLSCWVAAGTPTYKLVLEELP